MDDVLIHLPCGFVTKYGALKNVEKTIRCMMCEDEDINVDEILNRPGNRLRLKDQEVKIELENLKKMINHISSMKQDLNFQVDKSFERIFNELDLRKEIVKKEFEQKLDDHFTITRNHVLKLKDKIILDLKTSLAQNDKNLIVNSINLKNSNCTNLKDKLKLIESELNEILDKKKKLNNIISKSEFGDSLKLYYEKDKIQMKTLFGEIRSVLFDFKRDYILYGGSKDIWNIKQVDEHKILSTSLNIIKLWDLKDIKNPRHFVGHNSTICSLCIINDDHFASCSDDKTIKIWNLTSGKCIKTLTGHSDEISNLKLLSNGLLISCSSDETIKFWNYKTAKCVKTLTVHEVIYCIEEMKKNYIICGCEDETIKLWNVETSENVKTFIGHTRSIFCLQRLSSNRFASGSADRTIKIWDLEKEECLSTLEGHTDNVYEISLFKSGQLISCSEDGTIRIWDIDFSLCLKVIQFHNNGITSFLLTTNNEFIITGSRDETLNFWKRI